MATKAGKAPKAAPKKTTKPEDGDGKAKAAEAAAAEKAKKAAEAEKAKAAKAAEAEKKAKEAAKLLDPLAKAVVELARSADKRDHEATDKRLSLALNLAKAAETCQEMGITFKSWYAEKIGTVNVSFKHEEKGAEPKFLSYDEAKKLVVVGKSEEPALALADMRSAAAGRMRKLRAKQNDAKKAAKKGNKSAALLNQDRNIPVDPEVQAEEVLARVDDTKAIKVMSKAAEKLGFKVVPEAQAQGEAAEKRSAVSLAGLQTAFGALKASDKMAFVKWAVDQVGGEYSPPNFNKAPVTDDTIGDIPEALRRGTKTAPQATA